MLMLAGTSQTQSNQMNDTQRKALQSAQTEAASSWAASKWCDRTTTNRKIGFIRTATHAFVVFTLSFSLKEGADAQHSVQLTEIVRDHRSRSTQGHNSAICWCNQLPTPIAGGTDGGGPDGGAAGGGLGAAGGGMPGGGPIGGGMP